jgi:hypothetical protein
LRAWPPRAGTPGDRLVGITQRGDAASSFADMSDARQHGQQIISWHIFDKNAPPREVSMTEPVVGPAVVPDVAEVPGNKSK